ncbi:UNVERIFIED_CONTAM: hypothetical protein FKN15_002032 [Acipenser sinensis]
MTAKTLLQDNDELIKALLPSQLLNISTIAEECKRLAESTEKKFTDVILFIQEILEACLNSKQCYEEERRYISLKLEEAKMKKESSEQATKLEKNNKELTEILVTMRSCEIKEIDFQTTLKMLVKGLDAMGRVKEQWEKMVRFFQMISSLIQTCLIYLEEFVSTAENIQKVAGYSSNAFVKDMIYSQAFQVSNITSLVHMISGTYMEVSSQYVMDGVSSLGKLMGLDPRDRVFGSERIKLADACRAAQDGIYNLALMRKKEFERSITMRVEELLAVLSPASDKELKEIKASVQSGMQELTVEEENPFY